jgi:hypothetical protein
MELQVKSAGVRRVLLADGWHAVEDVGERGSGSSFEVGALRFIDEAGSASAEPGGDSLGFSFIDHHTKKRMVGPVRCIEALETD